MTSSARGMETYPLTFPERPRTTGFWLAFALCAFVASFIPAFIGYAAWYVYAGWSTNGWLSAPALVLFLYSCIEICFLLYLLFTSTYIQQPSPPSDLTSEQCTALFMRVLQSGLAERYEDVPPSNPDTDENDDDDEIKVDVSVRVTGSGVAASPARSSASKDSTPSRYNLRQRTPRTQDSSYVYKTATPSKPSTSRQNETNPLAAVDKRHEAASTSTPKANRSYTSAAQTNRRDSLSKDLDSQMHSILSGERYTFSSDLSVARRSHRSAVGISETGKTSYARLMDEQQRTGGMESPDVKVTRLDRDDERAIEFRERLRSWFGNAPFSSLTKHDVIEWLAWSSYSLRLEDVRHDSPSMALLEDSLGLVEARCGWVFPDPPPAKENPIGVLERLLIAAGLKKGNGRVKMMRLTIDPVNVLPRPFFMYWVPGVVNWYLKTRVYARLGTTVHREGAMEYLLRIPDGWRKDSSKASEDPILFLHGLGFGLLQNHFVIMQLLRNLSSHPIMIPLQPHISMQIFHPRHLVPFNRPETVTSIKLVCQRWGFFNNEETSGSATNHGIVIMSHSNGSVGHGWILKDCPTIAKRSAFVDPIVFCLWEGAVCERFCYRSPRTAMEMLLYYFIASEIGIANTIQRHFDWSTNTLFFEEIPHAKDEGRTAYFLGGKDVIVDAPRVKTYLNRHGVTSGIELDHDAGHGDGLAGPPLDRLISWLKTGHLG